MNAIRFGCHGEGGRSLTFITVYTTVRCSQGGMTSIVTYVFLRAVLHILRCQYGVTSEQ